MYSPELWCSLSTLCCVWLLLFFTVLLCWAKRCCSSLFASVRYLFVRSIHWDCFERKREKKKNNTIGFSKINKCTKCQKDKSNVNVSFWISLNTYRTCVKNRNRKLLMPAAAAAANKPMNKKMYQKKRTLFTGYKNLSIVIVEFLSCLYSDLCEFMRVSLVYASFEVFFFICSARIISQKRVI